jgi:hypothetical protein
MAKMKNNNISFEGIEEEDLINFKSIRRKDCLKQEEFDKEHNVTTFIGIKLAKDGSGEYVPTTIENRDKFILLLVVFGIIYFVDYITYINGILYSGNSALPSLKTPTPPLHHLPKIKNPKVKRNKSRRR